MLWIYHSDGTREPRRSGPDFPSGDSIRRSSKGPRLIIQNDVSSLLVWLRDVPMRAEDLDHQELLELDAAGGVIRFAGQRALLLDAIAMGLLRKYLVENFGVNAARAVLTQFGFAHGWRMAEALKAQFNWDTEEDWRRAGTRLPALAGLFRIEPGSEGPLSATGMLLGTSYEAEQHLLHFGQVTEPVCWTICGLISGYMSNSSGKEIFVQEDRCLGRGDAACHFHGRTR